MECSLIMYLPFPSQTNPNVAIRSVCIPFLTDENIEKLIETIDETKWEESLVRSNVSPTGAYQSSSRVSKLQFIDEKHIQLVQGLAGVISRCNDNNWRFDISSFNFNIDKLDLIQNEFIGLAFRSSIDFKLSYFTFTGGFSHYNSNQ